MESDQASIEANLSGPIYWYIGSEDASSIALLREAVPSGVLSRSTTALSIFSVSVSTGSLRGGVYPGRDWNFASWPASALPAVFLRPARKSSSDSAGVASGEPAG